MWRFRKAYASAGGSVENLRFLINGLYLHLYTNARRKLPLPREPAGVIPKEGTNLYWVAKLQGAVDRQYSFYADSCLVKKHVLL
jgi:hypothetical protein